MKRWIVRGWSWSKRLQTVEGGEFRWRWFARWVARRLRRRIHGHVYIIDRREYPA